MESIYLRTKNHNYLQLEEFDTFFWNGTELTIETDIESGAEFLDALTYSNSRKCIIKDYHNHTFPIITEGLIKRFTIESGYIDSSDDTAILILNIQQ